MPATPAWPPRSAPRLFIDQPLSSGASVTVDGSAAHYLAHVMRAQAGDAVRLFDDRTGDYAAIVVVAGRRTVTLAVGAMLGARDVTPDLWLCAAPIRRARFDWVAEKACELGVRRFVPVRTDRAVVDKVKPDRLRLQMIEAAEQCERSALPAIAELTPLDRLLAGWEASRPLYFADERGGVPFADAIDNANHPAGAILIGPEGGFTNQENAAIRACPGAIPISLGPRILRADTAAIAAVACWMALAGDGRSGVRRP